VGLFCVIRRECRNLLSESPGNGKSGRINLVNNIFGEGDVMSKKVLISALIFVVAAAASQIQAEAVEWTGSGSDDQWNTTENWDPCTPGAGDDVTITGAGDEGSAYIQLPQGQNSIEILSLETSGYIDLGAWGADWLRITIDGGSGFLTNNGELEIGTDGWMELNTNITNAEGAYLELEEVNVTGTLTNGPGATVEMFEVEIEGDVDNEGTLEIDPFGEMWVDGELNNYANGVIQLFGGDSGSETTIDNAGTIKGFGFISCDGEEEGGFFNSGNILAEGGVLLLYAGGSLDTTGGTIGNQFVSSLQIMARESVNNLGTMDVRSGGGIAISNNLNNQSGGIINLMGGTLAAQSITQSSGATFSGAGTIACQMGLTIEDGAVIELTGPTNIISNVTIDSGGTLIVRAGQTIIAGATTNNGTIVQAGGTVLFQNGYSGTGEIIESAAPDAEIIIDNGDAGTSSTGTWAVSGMAGFYGINSLYNWPELDASYSFETWAVGVREVSMWWTEHSSRSNSVTVEIYDGGNRIDTVVVNQQNNGGKWNVLGVYSFSNKAKVKILSSTSGATIADAVKIAPASDIIIDNGDVGTSSTGSWYVSGMAGFYGSNSLYTRTVDDTYTFETSVQVSSEVSLWWTAHTSRATNVSVKIYDGTTLLEAQTVNQQIKGGQWNVLGTYSFTDTAKVEVIAPGGNATVADAVKISPL